MTTIQTLWLSITLTLGALIIIEPRAVELIELLAKSVDIELRRRWLMLKLHPKNPITNWIMERKMKKLAAQLFKNINEQTICDE